MESEAITALGHFQNELIVNPLGGVVLSQFCTKTARLDPYHRIYMRIEVFLAPEDLGGNLILLRRDAGMFKGMVRQVLKKLAERLRAMERMAREKPLDLRELLGSLTHSITHRKPRERIVTPR